jgi:hypothetical protein
MCLFYQWQVMLIVHHTAGSRLTGRAPGRVTPFPWQLWRHWHKHVEDGPGDDHVVVDTHNGRYYYHPISYTCNMTLQIIVKNSMLTRHLNSDKLMFSDASKFVFAFDETIIFVHLSSTWSSSIESGSSCSSIQRPVSSLFSLSIWWDWYISPSPSLHPQRWTSTRPV